MSRLLERLLTWIADAIDRSLLMVPEVDDGQAGATDHHERQYWKDAATPVER
jgi:hypothetical protein